MKNLLKFINLKKCCSIMITLSLLLSVITQNVYAVNNEQVTDNFKKIFSNDSIINQDFGKITSVNDVGSNVTIINIQDLHCHFQTQQKISNIIKEINNVYFISNILVEGGYDNLNFDWINNIKDIKFKEKIISKLFETGELTGAEYYILQNNKENIIQGLDNQKLHKENLSRLSYIIDKNKTYSDVIDQLSREIKVLNNRHTNIRNKKFSKILKSYREGNLSATKFYRILFKYVNNITVNPSQYNNILPLTVENYPNISSFLSVSTNTKNIDTNLLSTQLQAFILNLKTNLPYKYYQQLLSDTNNFSNVQMLGNIILNYSNENDIDLKNKFNELYKFIENSKLSQNINPILLLKEEESLISHIRMALSYDNTEYEISYISDFLDYFDKYLHYNLTAYDWQYYKDNFDRFNQLYSKYTINNKIEFVKKDFDLINSYYDTNNTRNSFFVSNIFNNIDIDIEINNENLNSNRNPKEILKNSNKIIVVVAGGFHSEELKDILVSKNVNYITITPKITTKIDDSKIKYEQNVKIQSEIFSQAIALRIASSATNIEQKTLLVKAALQIIGNENIKHIEDILDNKIKITYLENGQYFVKLEDNTQLTIDVNDKKDILQQPNLLNILNNSTKTILEIIPDFSPTDGLKSIFVPNTYSVIKNLSLQLYNLDIYLSDGVIFDIEDSQYNGLELDNISPEVYSTFLPEVQKLLLEKEKNKDSSHDDKNLLSSTFNIKILNLFGIRNFEKQQEIIVGWEYAQIILGLFFPKIRENFKKQHPGDIEDKLSQLEQATDNKIKDIIGLSVSEIKNLSLISKIWNIAKILTNKSIKVFNKTQHLILNNVNPNDVNIDKDMKGILILTFLIDFAIIYYMHFTPITFIFFLFPTNSTLTLIWSLFGSNRAKIDNKESYESKYFSNIPETDYDYSKGAMDVTIQIPVYTEENDIIFKTIKQSMKAVSKYKQKSNARANILVCEDGLAPLLEGNISKEHIEELLSKPKEELSRQEQQAVERILFYRQNNISFIARPKENRAGLFKKASNMNHSYKTIKKLKEGVPVEDGTYYEGQELDVYDLILLLDKDSELHEDIISVTVPKFIKEDKLAYTQNSILPSNVEDNYFSKSIGIFTRFLYKHIFPSNAISGGLVAFIGHNGFIRTKALEEVGYWPENRVSEDYYTSTKFLSMGYHGKYLSFSGYEFKEMVSRSFVEESSKIFRYTFGLLELIFNKEKENNTEILTDWFKNFLNSEHITWYQKIHFFIYPLSYVNIISIIPVTLISILLFNFTPSFFAMGSILTSLTFFAVLYKTYKDAAVSEKDLKPVNILIKTARDLIVIGLTFISFSYVMIRGLYNFIFNYKKVRFPSTNVDKEDYTLRTSFDKIKEVFIQNKSLSNLFIVSAFTFMTADNLSSVNVLTSMFFVFAFIFATLLLNPFFINSLKTHILSLFKITQKKISITYKKYEYISISKDEDKCNIYISNNINDFDKKLLTNTGLKVNGQTIWQVKDDANLIFVANNVDFKDIAKTLNTSKILNNKIKKLLNLKQNQKIHIDLSAVIDNSLDDIYVDDGMILTNNDTNISGLYEIASSLAVTYSQKAIISLTNVANENLYNSIINASVRKVITQEQFEYLKNLFEKENKNIVLELQKLRENGIEIYIVCEDLTMEKVYRNYGITGQIINGKLFDYFTQEQIEIEEIDQSISIKDLENKIFYSQTPLLIDIHILQNLFKTSNNILDTYSMFDTLLGNIKLKFGFKNITEIDVKQFANNIKISSLPNIEKEQIDLMLSCNTDNFVTILNIEDGNIIATILNGTKISQENKEILLNIIKARILVKLKLQENNIEAISDKKLEILLSKLLVMQHANNDSTSLLNEELIDLSPANAIEKINKLYDKAIKENDPVAINTIMEIIIYMQDTKVNKFDDRQISTFDYKQMLAAA